MRKRASQQTEYPFFVTTNSIYRTPIFQEKEFAQEASRILLESKNTYPVQLYSFIIMPNHIHLIIKIEKNFSLSEFMKRYKSFVYKEFRRKFNFKDTFWQERYHYSIIETKKELFSRLKYIQNNPIKVEFPEYYNSLPYFYINSGQINKLFLP